MASLVDLSRSYQHLSYMGPHQQSGAEDYAQSVIEETNVQESNQSQESCLASLINLLLACWNGFKSLVYCCFPFLKPENTLVELANEPATLPPPSQARTEQRPQPLNRFERDSGFFGPNAQVPTLFDAFFGSRSMTSHAGAVFED